MYGGGVLVAVQDHLNATKLNIAAHYQERIIILMPTKIVIYCFGPSISLYNNRNLNQVLANVQTSCCSYVQTRISLSYIGIYVVNIGFYACTSWKPDILAPGFEFSSLW